MSIVTRSDTAPGTARGRPVLLVAIVLVASFLVVADASMVNVAIPVLERELGATSSQAQLVLAGYEIAFGVLLITGGRLGDRFGRRRMFLVGLAGFVVASVCCGLAPTAGILVGARVIQGALAALMFPQTLTVIQLVLPPHRRAGALTAFGITASLATVVGPLIAGVLIQLDLLGSSWRPSFLINVPIGLAGWWLARRYLPEFRSEGTHALDPLGVVVLTASLTMLTLPLIEGHELGWPWWTFVVLAASVPGFVLFGWRCRRQEARGGKPLIAPGLWRGHTFTVGFLAYFASYASIVSFFLYTSLTLQAGFGYSALDAALAVMPFAIGSAMGYVASLRALRRWSGRGTVLTGGAVWTFGVAGALATALLAGDALSGSLLVPSFVVAGVGLGFVLAPILGVILAGVEERLAGTASGVLTTGQQTGAVFGVAVVGVVFYGALGPQEHADAGAYVGAYAGGLALIVLVLFAATMLMRLLPTPTGHR